MRESCITMTYSAAVQRLQQEFVSVCVRVCVYVEFCDKVKPRRDLTASWNRRTILAL